MKGRILVCFLGLAAVAAQNLARDLPRTDAEILKTSIGMTLRRIPPGTFLMGSPPEEVAILLDEKPQHQVHISRPFYLGVFEVTQSEYAQIMKVNPSKFRSSDLLPVEQVSWFDAVNFCNKLSEREGRKPYYRLEGEKLSVRGGNGFRLPTEAEWEYACRAGSTTSFPFNSRKDTDPGAYAWFDANSGKKSHPVGKKRPNRFGLHDMMGNVWEWCEDGYDVDYYKHSPKSDPAGGNRTDLRVIRGSAWMVDAVLVRSAYRNRSRPADRYDHIGFRVAAFLD